MSNKKQLIHKYGTFDWKNQTPSKMPKSKDLKILELEQKIKLLEKQVENSDKKVVF